MPKKPLSKRAKILLYSLTVIIVLFVLMLRSCGLSGGPITGNVIDDTTGKPIAEAIVVAQWSGTAFALVESQTTCVRVESTTTNKKGKFFVGPWLQWSGGPISNQVVYFSAYKKGYQRVQDKFDGNTVYLEPFTGTRGARLEYLSTLSPPCTDKNLIDLYKALYIEAKDIVSSKADRKILAEIQINIDMIELGYEETTKRIRQGWYEK